MFKTMQNQYNLVSPTIEMLMNNADLKVCTGCRQELPALNFGIKDKSRGYRNNLCRTCESARVRWYYANNEDYREKSKKKNALYQREHPRSTEDQRRASLKLKYNLTPEMHAEILASQGGACALCGALTHGAGNRAEESWPVDHDHKNNRVRGILCKPCNTLLGGYEKIIEKVGVEKLAAYLAYQFAPEIPERETKDRPEWTRPPGFTDEDRFWSFVTKTDACWIWNGTLMQSGYPYFAMEGGKQMCARAAWKFAGKELPRTRKLRNTCGNVKCINPDHFVALTQGELTAMPGEAHPKSKLTADDIRLIRSCGDDARSLADRYGVTTTLIYNIRLRKAWKHVE